MNVPLAAAICLVAYLIGSLPFGLITVRLVSGTDIRTVGSGNIGATNVARVLGKKWGVLVLVLDCLKGALPTAFLPRLIVAGDLIGLTHLEVLCGLATILGHMFPCWIGFRGGKGVATALGVALVLAPVATAAAFLVFALAMATGRIVSLASILAAGAFCAVEMWRLAPTPFRESTWSVAAFSVLVPLLIVARHRTNIVRLWRGEEPRFPFRGKTSHDQTERRAG